MTFSANRTAPARDPKECGGQEVNVPDTSQSSYGKVTDQVQNCSRNLFWRKKQCYVYSAGPHTRTPPGHLRKFGKVVTEGPCIQTISQDLQTRTSCEYQRRTFTQAPMQSICEILVQGPLEDGFNRISTRSSDKDLYEIMQGPLKGFQQDLYKSFSCEKLRPRSSCQDPEENPTRSSEKDLLLQLTR